jgi:uncharacterized protein (TIGR02466 family)
MARDQSAGVDIRAAFATPIVTHELPTAKRLNAALRPLIVERAAAQPSTQHSNLGGWQSTWDLADWGGPAALDLVRAIEALASRLTADRQGRPVTPPWRANAWANVNRCGQGNEFHTHPGSFWSATYYIDDGGSARDPGLGGEFEFQDPRGVAPAMYAPNLCFAVPGGEAMGASETLRPRAGLVVLFPSWLSHAVRPYRGDGHRISIAVNLSL